MTLAESAEIFAKEKYGNATRADGIMYLDHLRGTVTRLKSLGVADQETIAAAWLTDIMNQNRITFDELDKRFGSKVAVLVLALSKDHNISKDQIEKQHTKQLRESPIEAKIIKLCDISTSLKNLKNSTWSKTRRTKQVKKEVHNLGIMKQDLSKAKDQYPGIQNIISGINEAILSYGQRPFVL